MRTGITFSGMWLVLILALTVSAYADFTRVGSIPMRFPEEPYGYAVTGLETIGDSLFVTTALDSSSAIYLIDPLDGGVINSYFWELTMPESLGDPSLSGAAHEPPFYYWVCDRLSGYHLNLTWTGGDTIAIYYSWRDDRITNPGGIEYEAYSTIWTVDGGELDSLYKAEPYGLIYGAWDIYHWGRASAVTQIPLAEGEQEDSNLLVCYDAISDSVLEYTKSGEFIEAHYLSGSPFDGGITAATFYDGKLYLGGQMDSIYIFESLQSYSDPVPAGDSIVVDVIPDELAVGFMHVGSPGSLYVEVFPHQSCPPPSGVTLFSDFYDISTTATFDYITKVALSNEGEFPPGINAHLVRAFVRPSGECQAWRDVTVEMLEVEESLRDPALAILSKRLSEDDEFSVFAFGEDRRSIREVVELKFDYLDSAITINEQQIPPTEFTVMSDLLDQARAAFGRRGYGYAARKVDNIADVALHTPEIPHTYDPDEGQGINIAGRIVSRAHTLSFSIRLMAREYQLPPLPMAPEKEPPINIDRGSNGWLTLSPTPSQSGFTVSFTGQGISPVSVRVYSVEGQLVRTLVDGAFLTGARRVTWDGRNDQGVPVAAGTYFAVLHEGDQRTVRKMVLQR
jgi:hypothetical protein